MLPLSQDINVLYLKTIRRSEENPGIRRIRRIRFRNPCVLKFSESVTLNWRLALCKLWDSKMDITDKEIAESCRQKRRRQSPDKPLEELHGA